MGITGSNASMLSRELGTKLTGRHITKELFPFSYAEYCGFTGKTIGDSSLYDYLHQGGFPQYLQLDDQDVLTDLVNDIVYRDIAVRYNIRDDHSLKSLLAYLMGNVGNLVSATKLKQILGMKSTSTVSDYFSYFEQTYLINFVPKFSYSYKAQLLNPKKVYLSPLHLSPVMRVGGWRTWFLRNCVAVILRYSIIMRTGRNATL